jgi:hypothetical protein
VWKEEGKIPWKKVGRNTIWYMVSYHTVLVSYRMVYGIVPYGIGPQGVKTACLCEKEACLLHSDSDGDRDRDRNRNRNRTDQKQEQVTCTCLPTCTWTWT